MATEPALAIEDLMGWTKYIRVGDKGISKQQFRFLADPATEILYGGAAGGGKMLRLDEPIPIPSGWTTMGEIRVGDVVFGADGAQTKVIGISEINREPECYWFQMDDGAYIESCKDHLWLTFDAKELAALTKSGEEWKAARRSRRGSRSSVGRGQKLNHTPAHRASLSERLTRWNREHPPAAKPAPSGTVRTTEEIARTIITPSGRTNHAIPVALPLQCPDAKLELTPYLLGIWLGDGTSSNGSITTADPEIAEAFVREGHCLGVKTQKKDNKAWSQYVLGLVGTLRHLGVLNNKHIPPAYARASIDQRLELLRGLMDTDGTVCDSGAVEYTTTNPRLASDVHELILSLGFKARLVQGVAVLDGVVVSKKWDIKWTPHCHVFHLERKRQKQVIAKRRTTKFRYITQAGRAAPSPMRCITVANPDGLYLAGLSFLVTHNSWCLLAGALQHVDTTGYSALILRKSYSDLIKAGALMDRAREWLSGSDADWEGLAHRWRFPSGASLEFGNLGDVGAEFHYQSAEYQYIGIDEAIQIPEKQLRYMFSRIRKVKGIDVPLRMRYATNPGGISHNHFKTRFVDAATREAGCLYIPARLRDNPYLDYAEYVHSLDHLDPITRRQLLDGDWTAREAGGYFKREQLPIFDAPHRPLEIAIRYWDLAASKTGKRTAGVLMGRTLDVVYYTVHVVKGKWPPAERDEVIRKTAEMDGKSVRIVIEQEPGSGGIAQVDTLARMLAGWDVRAGKITGDKVVRAGPLSSYIGRGLVRMIRGAWNADYVDELEAFPSGEYLDQVDASSGAFNELAETAPRWIPPGTKKKSAIDEEPKSGYESSMSGPRLDRHHERGKMLSDFYNGE